MAHSRTQIRCVGAFVVFATAMLFLPSATYAVGGCPNLFLNCIGCDNDEVSQVSCCFPHDCTPVEVENGGCNIPAICDYECSGHYYLHLYACPS